MNSIVLASTSPRRIDLLNQLGMRFSTISPGLDESGYLSEGSDEPESFATHMAFEKARIVAAALKGNELVIGADTLVISGRIMGKPANPGEAAAMLTYLQGKWHDVITGVCVIRAADGKTVTGFERTRVKIRPLDSEMISFYISTGEPLDKAGAYGIQGIGALIVEKLEGCYYNVVGLPLYRLSVMLRQGFGYDVFAG